MKWFLLLFFSLNLFAHQTGLSFIDIIEQTPKKILLTYKKPLSDTRSGDITIIFPPQCFFLSPYQTKIENGFIIKTTTMQCASSLQGKRIWIKGLVKSDRGVLIYYKQKNFEKKAILRSNAPFLSLENKNDTLSLIQQYIYLGITHILLGYDHLLFVLLLLLLAKNLRQLLYTVTAFTLAHSITLSCSILELFYLPPSYVEMMIALSIVFLAKEILLHKTTLTKRYLPVSSFSFGLLHGFGFSSALKDIGLPQGDIPLALFSFNVGIELGQIIFIFSVLLLLNLIKKQSFFYFIKKQHIAFIVGVIAAYWFWQRLILILN